MKHCSICQVELQGKQRLFCSSKCKQKSINNKHQNYKSQQKRGSERKLKLVKLKGGKCANCGYRKNYASLVFHHLDPKMKDFGIDLRKCSNSTWDDLLAEISKCQLLCHNCHHEVHHPDCNMVELDGFEPTTLEL